MRESFLAVTACSLYPPSRCDSDGLYRGRDEHMGSQGLDILVADNEEIVRELFDRHLSARGHSVDQAVSGNECLKRVGKKQYDLVFLDLVMPGVDGETALKTIRVRCPDAIVVIVSSQDDDGVIADLLARGVRAYLTKPCTQEHIDEVIAEVEREKQGVES